MKHPKTVKILPVAAVTAIVNWVLGTAVVFVLSPMLVSFGALPGPSLSSTADHHMVVAVVVPFVFAVVCFGLGALMAFLYNMFVKMLLEHRHPQLDPEPVDEIEVIGEVA